ncbi:MAG: formyltransferase family protein, partial [Actinomycetota bacterium]|nr:formyltransferase family protein [Actinomycetota bacterium]
MTSIAFIGDESLLIECATTARAAGASVVAVSTRSAVVRERAEIEGFRVIGSEDLLSFLVDHPVDVLFSIANEYVVSDDVIGRVRLAVNFHDGPLPDYKGLAVTTWALFHGEPRHAVTWHTMTTEVDAGEIVLAESFDIAPDETAFSLNARCYETALRTFPDVLQLVMSDQPALSAQADRPGKWFGRYQRPIVLLDPTTPAVELDRAVRALALGPRIRNRLGAVRWVVGDRALLVTATEVVAASGRPAGTVVLTDRGVQLATADGDLLVTELTTLDGDDLQPDALAALVGQAPATDAALLEHLGGADEHFARHETFWLDRLGRFHDARPTHLHLDAQHSWSRATVP